MSKGLKIGVIFGLIVITLVAALGCSTTSTTNPAITSTASSQQEVTLRMQSSYSPGTAVYEYNLRFADQVRKESNGLITIDVYPDGQLVQGPDMPTALPAGTVDMALINQTIGWPGVIPELNMMIALGLFDNLVHMERFTYGPFREMLKDKYSKINVKMLAYIYDGSLDTFCNNQRLIKLPEDVVGIKFRAPSATTVAAAEALGGAGVIIAAPETYMAIQRGTVNGVFGTTPGMGKTFKLFEVAKYWTRLPVSEGFRHVVVFNLDVWNSLSQENQKIIEHAADDWEKQMVPAVLQDYAETWGAIASEPGVQVYNVPPQDISKFLALLAPSTQKLISDKVPDWDVYQKMIEDAKWVR